MNHLTDAQLNEYLDQALDGDELRQVRSHLEGCPDCRERLDGLQAVFAHLAGLQDVQVSRDLRADILSRLPVNRAPLWTPSLAAQLGAVCGLLLWLSFQMTKWIQPFLAGLSSARVPTQYLPLQFPRFSDVLHLALAIPQFHLSLMPHPLSLSFPIPQLPSFPTPDLIWIGVSISILWLIGNYFLLWKQPEVDK